MPLDQFPSLAEYLGEEVIPALEKVVKSASAGPGEPRDCSDLGAVDSVPRDPALGEVNQSLLGASGGWDVGKSLHSASLV